MSENNRDTGPRNHQGGVALGDDQHRLTPNIARGDRAAEAIVSPTDTDPIGRVRYSQPVDGPVAPQMVDDRGEARPDSSFGDVAQVPTGASVWEAVEAQDGPVERPAHQSSAIEAESRAGGADYAPRPLGKNDIDDNREEDGP